MPLQLNEETSSKKRRPNWTDQECLLLAQLMQERKAVIRGKYSTGVSMQDKRQAWEEITQAINTTFPQIPRTVSDCNKKWENLVAKSREEIKRQKRQVGSEGLSLEEFSPVTKVVISMMYLTDMLQQDKEDAPVTVVKTQQNSFDNDGNNHTPEESFPNKHPLTEPNSPPHCDPTSSAEEQSMALTTVPKSAAVQLIANCTAGFTASTKQLNTPHSTSPPSAQCTTMQERMDLEMSVLRRQEAVLKLQEEYYTLKIKMMKKQMQETPSKD